MLARPRVSKPVKHLSSGQQSTDHTNVCRRSCRDSRSEWAQLRRVSAASRSANRDNPHPTLPAGASQDTQKRTPSHLNSGDGRSGRRCPSTPRKRHSQEATTTKAPPPTPRSPELHPRADPGVSPASSAACSWTPTLPRPPTDDADFKRFCRQFDLRPDTATIGLADLASTPLGYTLDDDARWKLQLGACEFVERLWFRIFLRHQQLLEAQGRRPQKTTPPQKREETPGLAPTDSESIDS